MSEVTVPQTGVAGPAPPQDRGTADQAKEKASEAAGQAQEKAQQAAGQAKGRARDEIDKRSTDAGQQVKTTADDLRSVGEQLRSQGKDTPAKLADQAADRAQRLGGYLEDSDADRILHDVEDFARKQPWAVVAGGLALGFAASRLLKASSTQRYSQRSSGSSSSGGSASNGASHDGNGHAAAELHRRAQPTEGISASGATFTDPGVGTAAGAVSTPSSGVTPAPRSTPPTPGV